MRQASFSVFLLSCFFINAAIASDVKIGLVNAAVVESEALMLKDIAAKSKATTEKIQKEVTNKEKELQKEVQELEKKRSVLSESALAEKQQALQQKVIGWQENIKKDNEAIERAKMECLSQVDSKAKDIVESLAKKHDLDLVFSSQSVLYSSSKITTDLTQEFIKELDYTAKKSDFDEYFKKYSKAKK